MANFIYISNDSSDDDAREDREEEIQQLEQEIGQLAHKISLTFCATTALVIVIGVLYSLNIIPRRAYTNADFQIETYRSATDQDGDGVDDQTDILASVREYLATQPRYQSKYYSGGYPDDNYGVCTDVVAFGLKGAGYDLMTLVDQDIRENPDLYEDAPDANIDFRRVKNLAVWFKRHTQSLTTDLNNYAEWQGGDIVIFKDHIGVVSDKRNKKGVPFLIHHYSSVQVTYEEDVLENYAQEIVGHYRVS